MTKGSALPMIEACFRHQHPEAFGGEPVPEPPIPTSVLFGNDELACSPQETRLPDPAATERSP